MCLEKIGQVMKAFIPHCVQDFEDSLEELDEATDRTLELVAQNGHKLKRKNFKKAPGECTDSVQPARHA